MKTPQEILDKHSAVRYSLNHEQQQFIIDAMQEYAQQIASLAWDAGYNWIYHELSDDDYQPTNPNPTKEQFLNSIFNKP